MKKLKLNRLSDNQLAEKQMNTLKGGTDQNNCPNGCCGCPSGVTTTGDNNAANNGKGLRSPNCVSVSNTVL